MCLVQRGHAHHDVHPRNELSPAVRSLTVSRGGALRTPRAVELRNSVNDAAASATCLAFTRDSSTSSVCYCDEQAARRSTSPIESDFRRLIASMRDPCVTRSTASWAMCDDLTPGPPLEACRRMARRDRGLPCNGVQTNLPNRPLPPPPQRPPTLTAGHRITMASGRRRLVGRRPRSSAVCLDRHGPREVDVY